MAEVWDFSFSGIRGELSALGGMLGPVWFRLPDGREVQPFGVAPWEDEAEEKFAGLPPLLRRLRGDWPCVPFGMPAARTDLPAAWMAGVDPSLPATDPDAHGYASNHDWRLVHRGADRIEIAIDYPDGHPVARLTRTIAPDGPGRLRIGLAIEMRRAARLPVGLHPVLALPAQVGAASLDLSAADHFRTFPTDAEPGVSRLLPDQVVSDPARMPLKDGGSADITVLPLPYATEELVLAVMREGRAALTNRPGGYRVTLGWDKEQLPQCLFWLSLRGRQYFPWNGRHLAIGIEPVASAFDLGEIHSLNPRSPARAAGLKTAMDLRPGPATVIDLTVAVDTAD